ncbi:MAG: dihydroorotase [Candidatus Aminicenantes bacterium]|nr:dihydroorotase [Candidatus Aminicenantes bacterium]MDH5714058.1 dihydroorotase [Candidatus Aminicenantes bacterium]
MKKLLVKGGRVIDPANNLDEHLDLLIAGGKIAQVGKQLEDKEAQIIDVQRLIVAPGFIDMHCHLREPGREDEETIESGCRAAAAGGFTSVACMPNTDPPNDSQSVTEFILKQAAEKGIVNVFPIGAATKGLLGEELAEIGELKETGIVAVSDDGHPIYNSNLMRKALEYAGMFDLPVIDHCEDKELSAHGVMNEGYYSTLLGLPGIPAAAEEIMVARNIILTALIKGHLHIAHLSTKGSVELLRWAKAQGLRVTAEVTPHHFTLTDKEVCSYDTNTKMNPPLRSAEDVKAILQGIKDGTIDAIATDHAPHRKDEKDVEYADAPFGIVGLETAVPLALDRLVNKRVISPSRMIAMFTVNPATILKLERGTLSPGAAADVTILNLSEVVKIDVTSFQSKSRNSPFHGWELIGRAVLTIVGGKVVWPAKSLT